MKKASQSDTRSITLDFPDISLHHTWNVDELPWITFASTNVSSEDRVTALDPSSLGALQRHIDLVSTEVPDEIRRVHKSAATAFLYILLSLETQAVTSHIYTLRSTIPIASGLGSSASISVCISAALLIQSRKIPDAWSSATGEQAGDHIEVINNWAYVGELCIHGTPSGIDNTVATRGKAVLFKRRAPPQSPSISPLPNFPTLPLLLCDSKQPRSTAVEVAKVGALKRCHPEVTECILEGVGKITETIADELQSGTLDFVKDAEKSSHRLGELLRLNHGLLSTLGVSHPKLERIRTIIDQADVGWTKLTGAGGGGCTFTLLNLNAPQGSLKGVEASLAEEGFARYETLFGGPGVGLLNVTEDTEESIIAEQFRQLQGPQEVEALVGIMSSKLSASWQFFNRKD